MSPTSTLQAELTASVGSLRLNVDLTVTRTTVVVGPNGSGKSSLLSLILGTLPIEQGRIDLAGVALFDSATALNVPLEQRGIGYVPQDYALFPHLNVRQNIEFALHSAPSKPSASGRPNRPAAAQRIGALLSDLGLESLAERRIQTLSGGEKQRVALARALSVGPRALLLDEPLAALDVHARREVRAFLAQYLEQLGLPTIVVTHDAADAQALGHQVAVLEAGTITQRGTWDTLSAHPASEFIAQLVGSGRYPANNLGK